MKTRGIEPTRRNIKEYEDKLKTDSLSIEQQIDILNELKARPYRFTYDETLESPVDFLIYMGRKPEYKRTLSVELDSGDIMTFNIAETEINK